MSHHAVTRIVIALCFLVAGLVAKRRELLNWSKRLGCPNCTFTRTCDECHQELTTY